MTPNRLRGRVFCLTAALGMASLAGAHAQRPARDANAAVTVPAGTGSLGGVVRDADDHPLRHATVSISGDMRFDRTVTTDDAGRFLFRNLSAGRFTVSAQKGGYPRMSYGATRPYRTGSGVLLAAGQQVTDIVLHLARGAVFTGTVYDDHGHPMPDVPIMAWEVRTSLSGERTLAFGSGEGAQTSSDDRGVYRIWGLAPGEYTIGSAWFYSSPDVTVPTDAEIRAAFAATEAGAPGQPGLASSPQVEPHHFSYARVFYPGVLDPLAAGTMRVAAGEERDGVDLHMQFQPMSRIEGTVVGPSGPVPNVRLSLSRRSSVRALNSRMVWPALSDGHFTTPDLGPGDYTILAELRGGGGKPSLWASQDVTIAGADPVVVTLTLQPGMTFTAHLVFDGTTLEPPSDLSRVRVTLAPAQGTSLNMASAQPPTGASAAVTISGIVPGRYLLRAGVPTTAAPGGPAWSVRSVVLGGQDVTDLPIDIERGDTPSATITFTDLVSELSGTFTTASGKPATDYFVVILPADRRYWSTGSRRIASTRPDTSGRYVFRGLPAGEYRLAATTDLVQADLRDPNALERLAAASTPVTLGVGEHKTFSFRIGR